MDDTGVFSGADLELRTRPFSERSQRGETRTERLRCRVMDTPPSICHERAALVTRRYQRDEGRYPPILLRAYALADVLDRMTISIGNDELIVGNQASRPGAAPIYPEYSWRWVLDELDTFEQRVTDRFVVPVESRKVLSQVLRWWKGKSLVDRARQRLPASVLCAQDALVCLLTSMGCGIGHLAPGYTRVLERGLLGIWEEAQERLAALGESLDSGVLRRAQDARTGAPDFYRAAIVVCKAVCRFARRFSELALELAEVERDPVRAAELCEIADVCTRVPAHPAASFQEALQSFWFVHLVLQIESNGHSISPGRFDQYMYSYYQADLDRGVLSEPRALELLECLWIKMNEVIKVRDAVSSMAFGGYPLFQNLIVGGQTPDGHDAINALSYLCVEATRRVRLPQPSLSVRVHEGSPRPFLLAAAGLAKEGLGMPAFFNDEAIVPILTDMGVPLTEARNYAEVGCVEPQSPGRTHGYYTGGYLNLGKVLSLALHNGVDSISGERVGWSDPEFECFASEADVWHAFQRQVDHFVDLIVEGDNVLDALHAQQAPNPFVSLLVDDCMVRGLAYEQGGAVHNYTSPNVVGLANVADAVMAVRRVVYEDRLVSIDELVGALVADFEGHEGLRLLLLNSVAKYGNDDPEVDRIARDVAGYVLRSFKRHHNVRGGTFEPGLQSISAHALFRGAVPATPDGRTRESLLADGGISPAQGRDRQGPTAVLRSAARLDQREASNGALLNLKLSRASVAGEGGTDRLIALVAAYFQLGGQHIQFNVIDTGTLRDAQVHPENYPNLLVRVAGFSVLFTAIDKVLQDDVIARTEHNL
jgi:formate C-acetyltransferase